MHKILVIRLYFPLDALHVSDYISPSSGATFMSCTSYLVYAGTIYGYVYRIYQYEDILLAREVACKYLNPTAIRHRVTASCHVVSFEIFDLQPGQKQLSIAQSRIVSNHVHGRIIPGNLTVAHMAQNSRLFYEVVVNTVPPTPGHWTLSQAS